MRRIRVKTRQITFGASLAAAITLVLLCVILWPRAAGIYVNELFLAAILVSTVPVAVLEYQHQKWLGKIEDLMPTLVRGISESQETGLTLVDALENVVTNKMVRSPLAEEVKRMTSQMSWGLSFEDALRNFRDRILSPVVTRFSALVLEASTSGGEIRKVFTSTSGFMEEMRDIDRETSAQMKPYLLIIYTAFFVYLSIAVILVNSFFSPLEGITNVLSSLAIVGAKEYKDFFYKTMLISGFMGGLMAGKIGERKLSSGLKHGIMMVVIGYIAFYILMPPNWRVV